MRAARWAGARTLGRRGAHPWAPRRAAQRWRTAPPLRPRAPPPARRARRALAPASPRHGRTAPKVRRGRGAAGGATLAGMATGAPAASSSGTPASVGSANSASVTRAAVSGRSGMARSRSVSCSSATSGGRSALRSTSGALGRSAGLCCVSQRTRRAACARAGHLKRAASGAALRQGAGRRRARGRWRGPRPGARLRVRGLPLCGQRAGGLQIRQQHRALHACRAGRSRSGQRAAAAKASRASRAPGAPVAKGCHSSKATMPSENRSAPAGRRPVRLSSCKARR